jgi:hypothetical protein
MWVGQRSSREDVNVNHKKVQLILGLFSNAVSTAEVT